MEGRVKFARESVAAIRLRPPVEITSIEKGAAMKYYAGMDVSLEETANREAEAIVRASWCCASVASLVGTAISALRCAGVKRVARGLVLMEMAWVHPGGEQRIALEDDGLAVVGAGDAHVADEPEQKTSSAGFPSGYPTRFVVKIITRRLTC